MECRETVVRILDNITVEHIPDSPVIGFREVGVKENILLLRYRVVCERDKWCAFAYYIVRPLYLQFLDIDDISTCKELEVNMLIGVLRQHEFLLKPCALVCREVHSLRCYIATIELKLATSAMRDITAYGVRSLPGSDILNSEQTVPVRGCIIVRYAIKSQSKASLGMYHVMMSHKTLHLGIVSEQVR